MKTSVRFTKYQPEGLKLKCRIIPSLCENAEQQKVAFTAARERKTVQLLLEGGLAVSYKTKHTLTM